MKFISKIKSITSTVKNYIFNQLSKIILLTDYDHANLKLSAKENQCHAAMHILWPISYLMFFRHHFGYIVACCFGLLHVILVIRREIFVETWQTPFKTRSDLITKLTGLIGIIL